MKQSTTLTTLPSICSAKLNKLHRVVGGKFYYTENTSKTNENNLYEKNLAKNKEVQTLREITEIQLSRNTPIELKKHEET